MKSGLPTTSCLQQLWRAKALMSLESGTHITFVYVRDSSRVFTLEMQCDDRKDLPLRTRWGCRTFLFWTRATCTGTCLNPTSSSFGRAGFLYPESSPMEERAHDFRTGNKAAGKLCLWRWVLTGIKPGRLRCKDWGGKIKNKFANSEKLSIIYLLEFSVYAENLVIHAFYEDRSI